MGSQIGNVITGRLNEHLKTFNNPDSKKTKDLFQEFFGLDVTESWVWGNFHTAKDTRTALNSWLRKRGEAVHRAHTDKQSSHIIKRDEVDKCIRFFRELVAVTDKNYRRYNSYNKALKTDCKREAVLVQISFVCLWRFSGAFAAT